uniref:Suppressor of white apricot N-terminal domain-containing protein n=1 Tax=Parascaris univalens TaxID=6257 RepID=A0A915CHP1_PARUN
MATISGHRWMWKSCSVITRVSERTFLKEIAAKEFWPDESASTNRIELEKKKHSRDKKAAVAFSYEDTTTVKGSTQSHISDSSDDEDEIIEPDEFDLKFDLDSLDAERKRNLNKLAAKYGIMSGAFTKLLKMDRREQDETHQLKEIEKAKLALAGRQAKAERALLKKKRSLIVGKGCLNEEATTTLLSFVTQNMKQCEESSSSSPSSDGEERTEFITSFGDEGENSGGKTNTDEFLDEDERNVVHGPALPSAEFRRIFELKTRHSSSPEDLSGVASTSGSVKRRARSKSPMRRMRSKSRERVSRRDRMRSRSRDRERSRSKGRERSRRDRRSTSREHRSRRRSRSNLSRGRSRSSEESRSRERSYHSASKTDDGRKRRKSPSSPSRRHTSASNERKGSDRRVRRSSSRESDRLMSPPPGQARGTGSILSPSRSDGDMSPLEIRSSMSESERERIEVENRRRRIRRTAKLHRQQYANNHHDKSSEDESEKKSALAHRLRLQMQRALRKTAEQLKEEQRHKLAEQMEQRRRREERVYEESLELRRREREKRHRERRRYGSSSSSG